MSPGKDFFKNRGLQETNLFQSRGLYFLETSILKDSLSWRPLFLKKSFPRVLYFKMKSVPGERQRSLERNSNSFNQRSPGKEFLLKLEVSRKGVPLKIEVSRKGIPFRIEVSRQGVPFKIEVSRKGIPFKIEVQDFLQKQRSPGKGFISKQRYPNTYLVLGRLSEYIFNIGKALRMRITRKKHYFQTGNPQTQGKNNISKWDPKTHKEKTNKTIFRQRWPPSTQFFVFSLRKTRTQKQLLGSPRSPKVAFWFFLETNQQ